VKAKAERDYLLMAPTAVKEHVCNCIGVIPDGFVGISELSSGICCWTKAIVRNDCATYGGKFDFCSATVL
jgi:hypothetical protein